MREYIVSLDVETTGLDRTKDRIIQLSLVKYNTLKREIVERKSWYIVPTGAWHINESATVVHNLTDDIIKEKGIKLESIADEIIQFIDGCDLLTYNGSTFDWNFVQREFERIDREFPFEGHTIYDSFAIETALHSHKLADVYKRYTGLDLGDAHDAGADATATLEVLMHQMEEFGEEAISEIAGETTKQTMLSPEQTIRLNENGELILTLGKYKGRNILDVCVEDMRYIKWMTDQGFFTKPTKNAIARAWRRAKA